MQTSVAHTAPQAALARTPAPLRHGAQARTAVNARQVRCRVIGESLGKDWNEDDYVEVGIIGAAHGVMGEVRVRIETSFAEERFGVPGSRYIQAPSDEGLMRSRASPPRLVHLESGREHHVKGHLVWLLTLKECYSRETADDLKNYRVLIHVNDREELDNDDEFYSQQLIGLTVTLPDPAAPGTPPRRIGSVIDIYSGAGTHDLLRIRFDRGLVLSPEGELVNTWTAAAPASEDSETEGSSAASASETAGDSEVAGTGSEAGEESAELSGALGSEQVEQVAQNGVGLLPFVRAMVPDVSLSEGTIGIAPPGGWLAMYLTPKEIKEKRKPRSKKPRGRRLEKQRAEQKEYEQSGAGLAVSTASAGSE